MTKPLRFLPIGLLILVSAIAGCNKEEPLETVVFDRTEMLRNYAEQHIQPGFNELNNTVNTLNDAIIAFSNEVNESSLEAAKEAWRLAYLQFMKVNSFNFGPAGEQGLSKNLTEEAATWPANASLIEANIEAGNASLNDFNRDSRGFHAMDYLLFADDAATTLSAFADPNRVDYLRAISERLLSQVSVVNAQWSGSYLSDFLANNGTDVGSSTSMLYNEFVKSFEALKNFKLALPMGLRAGQTQAEPQLVEARYSALSLDCFRAHYSTIVDLWYGRTAGGSSSIGWRTYIASVDGGDVLINSTEAQLALIDQALESIPNEPSLELQIGSNFDDLNTLHTRLQQHTRFFKSDMSSLLGITITFSSGDGD